MAKDKDITWEKFEEKSKGVSIHRRFEGLCRELMCCSWLKHKDLESIRSLYDEYGNRTCYVPLSSDYLGGMTAMQSMYLLIDEDEDRKTRIGSIVDKIIEKDGKKEGEGYPFCYLVFFLNKDISEDVKGENEKKLNDCGINVIWICNEQLLERLRTADESLKDYYFGLAECPIRRFSENIGAHVSYLDSCDTVRRDCVTRGMEYSLENPCSDDVSLTLEGALAVFTHSKSGAAYFNDRKRELGSRLDNSTYEYSGGGNSGFIFRVLKKLRKLENVNAGSIVEAAEWKNRILQGQEPEYEKVKASLPRGITSEIDAFGFDESKNLLKKNVFLRNAHYAEPPVVLLRLARNLVDSGRYCAYFNTDEFDDSRSVLDEASEKLSVCDSIYELVDWFEYRGGENGGLPSVLIFEGSSAPRDLAALMEYVSRKSYVKLIASFKNIVSLEEGNPAFEREADFPLSGNDVVDIFRGYDLPFVPCYFFKDELPFYKDKTAYTDEYIRRMVESNPLRCDAVSYAEGYLKEKSAEFFSFMSRFYEKPDAVEEETRGFFFYLVKEVSRAVNEDGKKDVYDEVRRILSGSRLFFSGDLAQKACKALERLDFFPPNATCYSSMTTNWFVWTYCLAKESVSGCLFQEDFRRIIRERLSEAFSDDSGNQTSYDIAIWLSAIYADWFGKEWFEEYSEGWNILEKWKQDIGFSDFLRSLAFRSTPVDIHRIFNLIKNDSVLIETFCKNFFISSTVVNSPFNALKLHDLLGEIEISEFDMYWTIPVVRWRAEIQGLLDFVRDYPELVRFRTEDEMEMLEILLAWLLSSCVSAIRDGASDALITLLIRKPGMCIRLLERFTGVKDSYIRERLYEVVFWSVSNNPEVVDAEWSRLAAYVYSDVFSRQDGTLPDVVVRDAAYLIIEDYLKNHKNERDKYPKHVPPYKAWAEVDDGKLSSRVPASAGPGSNKISLSMEEVSKEGHICSEWGSSVVRPSLPKMKKEEYESFRDYCIRLIYDRLGYSDEKFGDFDKETDDVIKLDGMICGKYQWIAYNIALAGLHDRKGINIYKSSGIDNPFNFRRYHPAQRMTALSDRAEEVKKGYGRYLSLFRDNLFILADKGEESLSNWKAEFAGKDDLRGLLVYLDKYGEKWIKLSLKIYIPLSKNGASFLLVLNGLFLSEEQIGKLEGYRSTGHCFYSVDDVSLDGNRFLHEYMADAVGDDGEHKLYINGSYDLGDCVFPLRQYSFDPDKRGISVLSSDIMKALDLSFGENRREVYRDGELAGFYYDIGDGTNFSYVVRDSLLEEMEKKLGRKVVWFVYADKIRKAGDYRSYSGYAVRNEGGGLDDFICPVNGNREDSCGKEE